MSNSSNLIHAIVFSVVVSIPISVLVIFFNKLVIQPMKGGF